MVLFYFWPVINLKLAFLSFLSSLLQFPLSLFPRLNGWWALGKHFCQENVFKWVHREDRDPRQKSSSTTATATTATIKRNCLWLCFCCWCCWQETNWVLQQKIRSVALIDTKSPIQSIQFNWNMCLSLLRDTPAAVSGGPRVFVFSFMAVPRWLPLLCLPNQNTMLIVMVTLLFADWKWINWATLSPTEWTPSEFPFLFLFPWVSEFS